MNYNDIQKINGLVAERRSIVTALASFDRGGRIVGMTVGMPPPEGHPTPPVAMGAQVNTQYINYPPGMVDSIKAAFATRQQQITQELAQLGVTGVQ
jgi:hypothetical protein